MGGGKSDATAARTTANSQADIGKRLVDFAQGQWNESAPYRKTTGDYWSNIIKGGSQLQTAVAPQINSATQQFATARKSANELPPGGLRDISLRNLGVAEAGTKTGIYSSGVNDAIMRLANQANLGTQAGLSGMSGGLSGYGGASGTYTNLAKIGMQSSESMGAGIGSLIAML